MLVRDKDAPADWRRAHAEALQAALAPTGARIAVSDDLELAAALGLDLHLSERGPKLAQARRCCPDARVGVSAHDAAGLARPADYATLSPVRASPGKGPALGWAEFAAMVSARPVYALGGLGPRDAGAAARAGACGIAAIRSAWSCPPRDWARAITPWGSA